MKEKIFTQSLLSGLYGGNLLTTLKASSEEFLANHLASTDN